MNVERDRADLDGVMKMKWDVDLEWNVDGVRLKGLKIEDVISKKAKKEGLQKGMYIWKVDNTEVTASTFPAALEKARQDKVKDKVKMTFNGNYLFSFFLSQFDVTNIFQSLHNDYFFFFECIRVFSPSPVPKWIGSIAR